METRQQKRKPSYLQEVQEQLPQLILSLGCGGCQVADEMIQKLWDFLRKQLVQSYYNGVRDGASGKVKPKAQSHNPKS